MQRATGGNRQEKDYHAPGNRYPIQRHLENTWKIQGFSRREASVTDETNGKIKERKPREGDIELELSRCSQFGELPHIRCRRCGWQDSLNVSSISLVPISVQLSVVFQEML